MLPLSRQLSGIPDNCRLKREHSFISKANWRSERSGLDLACGDQNCVTFLILGVDAPSAAWDEALDETFPPG